MARTSAPILPDATIRFTEFAFICINGNHQPTYPVSCNISRGLACGSLRGLYRLPRFWIIAFVCRHSESLLGLIPRFFSSLGSWCRISNHLHWYTKIFFIERCQRFDTWSYLFLGRRVQKWYQNCSITSGFWDMGYPNFHPFLIFFLAKSETVFTFWLKKKCLS